MRTYLKLVPLALGATLFAGCLGGAEALDGNDNDAPYGGNAPYGSGANPGDGSNAGNGTGIDPGTGNETGTPDDTGNVGGVTDPGSTGRCATGRVHVGIGGRVLVSTRTDLDATVDRRRVKPYSALQGANGEFARVLGNTPASLAGAAQTFGAPPARWSEEPQLGSISLFTAFQVGFQGCLTLTSTGTDYAAAPNATSAASVCSTLSKRFWSREATPTELDACTEMAITGTATETNARRRWAYTCATLLTTSGFLSY